MGGAFLEAFNRKRHSKTPQTVAVWLFVRFCRCLFAKLLYSEITKPMDIGGNVLQKVLPAFFKEILASS